MQEILINTRLNDDAWCPYEAWRKHIHEPRKLRAAPLSGEPAAGSLPATTTSEPLPAIPIP